MIHVKPVNGALTPWMKLWYTNNSLFTSYTTITPHNNFRSNFFTYVMSHVQYTYMYRIIATCIECATVLWTNYTRITRISPKQYKAGESVLCYS